MSEQSITLLVTFLQSNYLPHALSRMAQTSGLYGTEEWTPDCFEHVGTVPAEGKTYLGNCHHR